LQEISDETSTALEAVGRFPEIFRRSLERENKLCLGSFLGAETDDLPEEVLAETRRFSEINIEWIANKLIEAGTCDSHSAVTRASTIFAAIAGAQLLARTRSDLSLFDTLVNGYRASGLLPSP
jgi:TetR/AcrR family transcriptional repressor of nem operon